MEKNLYSLCIERLTRDQSINKYIYLLKSLIDVSDGPDNVSLSPATANYTVTEGNNLAAITCSATCYPACTYKWSRSKVIVSSTSTLVLSKIERRKDGSYICTARNPGSNGPDKVLMSPAYRSYTLTEGDNLVIKCSAMCSPACTYTWSGSGNPWTIPWVTLSYKATLNIGQIKRFEARSYMCTAQNSISSVPKHDGPDTVFINPSQTSYTMTEGLTMGVIYCYANCNPPCVYTWSRSGRTVRSNNTLNLGEVERGEAGSYVCTAKNPDGPSSLMLSPSTLRYIKNEGDTLGEITCSADCFPECNIRWQRTSGVSLNVVSYNAYMSIGKLDRSKRGSYRCEAINPDTRSKTTNTVTVDVRYGPDDVTLNVPHIHTVTEGDTVKNIYCSADCWPGCVFTWSNMTKKQQVSSSTVLEFRIAHRYDADSPDVVISQSTAFLNENAPLDLLCKATGVPAVYNYTGFLQRVNDIVVPNSHVGRPGLRDSISVNIPALRLQDTGVYTCYVHNGIIGHNKQLLQTVSRKVEVQASPRFLLDGTNFAGETSGNITIAIPFISIPEFTSYNVLRHDGQAVSTNGKCSLHIRNESVHPLFYGQRVKLTGNVLEIIIRDLSEKDFGKYKMQITNDINTANFSIDVKATSRPSQPTELNLTTLDNIVTFDWNKGFNGEKQTSIPEAMIGGTAGGGIDIPDEVDNPMYVSGDDVDIPKATTADIYATPDKKKPKQNEGAGDICAVVDKKKNSKNKEAG
ncbi:HMCN2-like protein [Mya arenaria]|uniref:HMCN2-like protein n=1 Tax=Mya arenaria TaxID=6604 RepID=A0ABY7E8S3_MYAAR|nr:HMCN2-like protein [Mya arenaria]